MKIILDTLPEGQRNRPSKNPASSRYNIIIPPKWITIHNAWSPWDARGLNEYQKTGEAITRPASWHLSCGMIEVVQGIPFGETAWHAGDYVNVANPGIGNTQSIGIEVCDFYDANTKTNDQAKYLIAEANSQILVAYLIRTVSSLLPFPECVVPHTKWRPASGCPSRILSRKDGWANYIQGVREILNTKVEIKPDPSLPVIQRPIGIEVLGKKVTEPAYLINNSTYVRAAYIISLLRSKGYTNAKVTGHGDHIKISL
jgi:N-acetylmuramoyl-L-alanine amidase CwlA